MNFKAHLAEFGVDSPKNIWVVPSLKQVIVSLEDDGFLRFGYSDQHDDEMLYVIGQGYITDLEYILDLISYFGNGEVYETDFDNSPVDAVARFLWELHEADNSLIIHEIEEDWYTQDQEYHMVYAEIESKGIILICEVEFQGDNTTVVAHSMYRYQENPNPLKYSWCHN